MKPVVNVNKIGRVDNLRYKVGLEPYKRKVTKLFEILFSLPEVQSSKIFSYKLNRVGIDISFCADSTIRFINKKYRDKDKVTDVITFALFCDTDYPEIYRSKAELGQIIVDLEQTNRQRAEASFEEELFTLICHGGVHLLGFDHQTQEEYDFVVDVQNKVLKEFWAQC